MRRGFRTPPKSRGVLPPQVAATVAVVKESALAWAKVGYEILDGIPELCEVQPRLRAALRAALDDFTRQVKAADPTRRCGYDTIRRLVDKQSHEIHEEIRKLQEAWDRMDVEHRPPALAALFQQIEVFSGSDHGEK